MFGSSKNCCTFAPLLTTTRAVSAVGSEHLPYKQRVGGSNPSLPTRAVRTSVRAVCCFTCPSPFTLKTNGIRTDCEPLASNQLKKNLATWRLSVRFVEHFVAIFFEKMLPVQEKAVPLQPGKSYTASSLLIPQVLTEARVTRL